MRDFDYWQEAIAQSAEEHGVTMTPEQRDGMACDMISSHEHYGLAFYQPPASDRLADIEREWAGKLAAMKAERDAVANRADKAIRQALRIRGDVPVSIADHGEVFTHGGRTEQVQ